jgi:hypothetical protein
VLNTGRLAPVTRVARDRIANIVGN